MVEKTAGTAEVPVDAASGEKVPDLKTGKDRAITTSVWVADTYDAEGKPEKKASRDQLFAQAIANVRDAVPVASYDVACQVKDTKSKQIDHTPGTLWEVEVTFTPRGQKPEPVDLQKIIDEAKAGFGDSHPGDPNFLDDDPK